MRKWLFRSALILAAALLVAQFVPMARTNPPVTREVRWDSPATRDLVRRACGDCHSNATVWPWYSHVAPSSWLVINHVDDGRRRLNFSTWDQPQRATMRDIEHQVTTGEMPIWNYLLLHPEARLTDTEKQQLLNGLRATLQQDPPIPRHR